MPVPPPSTARRVTRLAGFACVAAPAAACAAGEPLPLAYVAHAAGPAAQPVFVLGWALLALCTAVSLVIAALLLAALFHRRTRTGGRRDGVLFVAAGSAVSIVLLFGALVYMLRVLGAVATPPRPPALTIVVTAHDWWWAARYPDPASGTGFVTANELHIPVGEPVAIELKSADVIHAFWVPQLAGKTQTIPGQTNRQWLQADRPGIYRGQCSQYCGARMRMALEVVAEPPAAFHAWLAAQRQPPHPAPMRNGAAGASSRRAARVATRCSAPTRRATPRSHARRVAPAARGRHARQHPDNLRRWIAHAQQIKPDALMPSIALAPRDADDLAAYLATLH